MVDAQSQSLCVQRFWDPTVKAALNDVQNSGQINYNNYYSSRANKRQSPSTVSAEAFLKARISLSPVYLHNEMMTKIQNISDLTKNPPRFRDQVDLLA